MTTMKKNIQYTPDFLKTYNAIKNLGLNTICIDANCPNISECFSKKKATFLILGTVCTRICSYCSVKKGEKGEIPDIEEINKILGYILDNSLNYVVITSVTRDDLSDGGSMFYKYLAEKIKTRNNNLILEFLTPDFGYKTESINNIISSKADIISHNIELTKTVYNKYRPSSSYESSIKLLSEYVKSGKKTKTALILGFGESWVDIIETIDDIYKIGINYLCIGQYLAPTRKHLQPIKLYSNEEFQSLNDYVSKNYDFEKLDISFFSRSSYMDLSYV